MALHRDAYIQAAMKIIAGPEHDEISPEQDKIEVPESKTPQSVKLMDCHSEQPGVSTTSGMLDETSKPLVEMASLQN
jgi:hypothetical protein